MTGFLSLERACNVVLYSGWDGERDILDGMDKAREWMAQASDEEIIVRAAAILAAIRVEMQAAREGR
jgi:hypothetical protein